MYALDDPTAFAYGNENFSYVEDYLVYEAKQHNRSVTFYGETAYWVNVDIDVPLFLPLYGQRRQHDLRRIAVREHREGFRIDGQVQTLLIVFTILLFLLLRIDCALCTTVSISIPHGCFR